MVRAPAATHPHLARAGHFLRSRAALHNTPLTDIEKLRTPRAAESDDEAAIFGRLESQGEVRAIFYLTPLRRLGLTPLSAAQTDTLAAHLAGLGHSPAHVIAERDTAGAFSESRQKHTRAASAPFWKTHLYRLGTLTPPQPGPAGQGRLTGRKDRDEIVHWCREFCVEVEEQRSIDLIDAGSWEDSRFGDRRFMFWETPEGVPVSMAASTSVVGGTAGATDVVLFTDPDNPTSNALYQRIGYVHLADFAGYRFSYDAPEAG